MSSAAPNPARAGLFFPSNALRPVAVASKYAERILRKKEVRVIRRSEHEKRQGQRREAPARAARAGR
eukprot:11903721-Alexandrium_andersonii.AAC.1